MKIIFFSCSLDVGQFSYKGWQKKKRKKKMINGISYKLKITVLHKISLMKQKYKPQTRRK